MVERDPEVLAAFAEESAERLLALEQGIEQMERTAPWPNQDLLNAVFRHAHSIKAGANLLGLAVIGRAAHALENVLDAVRKGRLSATAAVCQEMLAGVDLLHDLVDAPATTLAHVQARMDALEALAPAARP